MLYFCLLQTNSMHPCNWFLREKLAVFQRVKKIPHILRNTEIIHIINIYIYMYIYHVTRRKSECKLVILRDSRVTTPCPTLLPTRDPEHQHKSWRQHFTWALPEGWVGWRELNYVLPISRRRVRERERDKKGCYHHPGNYPGGNYLFLEHACNKLWTTITTWEVSRGVMFAALLVTLLSVTTTVLCYLKHNNLYVRSEVLTEVSITARRFWDMTVCTLLNRYRHFEAV